MSGDALCVGVHDRLGLGVCLGSAGRTADEINGVPTPAPGAQVAGSRCGGVPGAGGGVPCRPTSRPASGRQRLSARLHLPASLQVFERGWLSANNVLLFDGDEATLIDSGYVSHATRR